MTTSAKTLTLRTAIGPYGYFEPLKNGSLGLDRISFDHVEIEPIRNAFRRQCRNQEFDVSEMAIVTYLLARDYGLPFIALPVFCTRNFWHGAYMYNADSGIREPKDVEGKTGGVRAYTQTSGVWARGILQHEYGVELDKIKWILADEEHVDAYHAAVPQNVEYRLGANHAKLLESGETSFAMGVGRSENKAIQPLIPNARAAAEEWYTRTGLYPIDHMIVMKQSTLNDNPWLADALFEAFRAAKKQWQDAAPDELDRKTLAGGTIPGDRFPYGVEQNRATVEAMIDLAQEQHILRRSQAIDDLFAPSTLKS
jgi:4,5-dihydroxyphthalate decarboxylase